VRIVAATNQNLATAMERGHFREDLFYRLSVVTIAVPPLRARKEDIPLLADGLLARIEARRGLAPRQLSPAALRALHTHDWPGNVRELENTLERALVLAQAEEIEPENLELAAQPQLLADGGIPGGALTLAAAEAQRIIQVLEITGGRLGQAAALLGIDRKTLWRKIKAYQLR
jgi:DNA-binding NtrC family response regulator